MPASAGQPAVEADEFAAIPRSRTRHPLLALGAGLLAVFLVIKMRADLKYVLSPQEATDLGDARALVASDRGLGVLAGGTNRRVRVHGTPDRESALQVDTKGSWTFTQFFKILGTDGRLFIHRREDPLPGFRAERDVFEGRLLKFSDLSFEDAIRAYFAGHVSTTHFFRPEDIRRIVGANADHPEGPATVRDLAGDAVTLGPNDILAIDVRHAGEVEVALPAPRFADPHAARLALEARGARVVRPGRPLAQRQVWVVAVSASERDRIFDAIAGLDPHVDIRDARDTTKARLGDLTVAHAHAGDGDGDGNGHGDGKLAVRSTAAAAETAGAKQEASGPRVLEDIDNIRTLGTVQIPPDAYLIVEAETQREHLPDVAIALILLVFASVNLVGMVKGMQR